MVVAAAAAVQQRQEVQKRGGDLSEEQYTQAYIDHQTHSLLATCSTNGATCLKS